MACTHWGVDNLTRVASLHYYIFTLGIFNILKDAEYFIIKMDEIFSA